MSKEPGPDKLSKFLERNGISKARVAVDLGVSAVAVFNWLTRRAVPTPERRKAIETWTSGEVVEADWLTEEERALAERMATVAPYVPAKGGA